jgi:hypothetical protein
MPDWGALSSRQRGALRAAHGKHESGGQSETDGKRRHRGRVTAGLLPDHAEHGRAEKAAEVADGVDYGNAAGGRRTAAEEVNELAPAMRPNARTTMQAPKMLSDQSLTQRSRRIC